MRTKNGKSKVRSVKKTRNPLVAAVTAEQRRLVTAQEVERVTGLRAESIYKMVRAGVCPCYRRGVKQRGLLFDVEEVLRALRQPVVREKKNEMTGSEAKG